MGKHPVVMLFLKKYGLQTHKYISSFPTQCTHYTEKPINYLDAQLSVKTVYDMFMIQRKVPV